MVDAKIIAYLFAITGIALLATYAAWGFLEEEFGWAETSKNTVLVLGAGATFLGIYTAAMSTERYVKAETIVSSCAAGLENLDRILTELQIEGSGIYLPKSHVGKPRVFIPASTKDTALPDLRGDPTFLTGTAGPAGLLITPPGHGLCTLLEDELEVELDELEPGGFATLVPPLLSQGLGLAESVEIDEERLTFSISSPFCSELCSLGMRSCRQIGCPLCSCISEGLSRSLATPLRLESLTYDAAADVVKATLSRLGE